nr:transposon TX1 [Tanacetum cinerariifolium]
PDCVIRDRFKNVKEELKNWSKEKFGGTKKDIKMHKSEAMKWELEAEVRNLNEVELGEWVEARRLWINKEYENLSMLKQKVRIKWDIEGDENSKFFHAMVKRRNNKNSIRGLMIDGVWCEDPSKIKDEIFRYYKGMFASREMVRPRFDNNRVP